MPPRTIAIGDIHGCSAALAALVEAVRPTTGDLIVPLGDYIDRGKDSRGVLDQLIDLAPRCRLVPLTGNHEEMLLAARSDAWALRFWLLVGGTATLASYGCVSGGIRPNDLLGLIPEEHWRFLEGCRKVYESAGHVFTHSKEEFRLPSDPEDGRPLWPRFSGKRAVVGHTAQKNGEVLDEGHSVCIDTYCYGGGWLTALDVTTGQVWQADRDGRLRGPR